MMFRGKGESMCRNIRGMLSEYIDNRLDSEKKSLIERHLETCEACSRELESLRMTVQLLHRVPEVPAPRSFTIAAPVSRRESAFGPASLRWLRPATAVVAIALVVLLMGDFFNAFGTRPGVDLGPGNVSLSGGLQSVPTYVNPEQQTFVTVPGVMGQMSLATAKAVGYKDYTIVHSPPPSQLVPPMPTDRGHEGSSGAGVVSPPGETGAGWPLRQTEIGLGALAFVLLVLIIFARRQRRKKVGVR